ncbi:MAG: hypothetical protein MHM6MM_001763 [Cercozoa sp. M6MM]
MSREFSPRRSPMRSPMQVLNRSSGDKMTPLQITVPSDSRPPLSRPTSTTSSDAGFSPMRSLRGPTSISSSGISGNSNPHPLSVPLNHRGLPSPNDGYRGLPTVQHPSPSVMMRDCVLSRKTPVGGMNRSIMPSLDLSSNEKLSRRQQQRQQHHQQPHGSSELSTSPTMDGFANPEALPAVENPLAAYDPTTLCEYPSPMYQGQCEHSALEPMPGHVPEAGSALPEKTETATSGIASRLKSLAV